MLLTLILISLIPSIIAPITGYMLYQRYKDYRRLGLILLAIGFTINSFFGLAYLLLFLPPNTIGIEFVSILFELFIIIGLCWSTIFIITGYIQLTEDDIPPRFYYHIVMGLIIFPLILYKLTTYSWNGINWDVSYRPPWSRFFLAIYIAGFSLEIVYSVYNFTKDSIVNSLKYFNYAILISFILSLTTYILRGNVIDIVNLHVLFVFIFIGSVGMMVYLHPEVFLTTSITPQFLMLINPNSGLPIKLYHFRQTKIDETNEMLLAGALTAIQSIFSESSNEMEDIDYISFRDTILIFESLDQIQLILSVKKYSQALQKILKIIISRINREIGTPSNDDIDLITSIIFDAFSHQIQRLELLLEEVKLDEITKNQSR